MRKRKRDWPMKVYKYWARPLSEPPDLLFDIARRMQALWNQLVQTYNDSQFAIETLPDADKTEIRAQADAAGRRAAGQADLSWEYSGEVLDRFRAARTRAFRAVKQGIPVHKAGFPQARERPRTIAIPHRFTGGGIPVSGLFSDRAWRFRFDEHVPVDAYRDNRRRSRYERRATASFGLDKDTSIAFATVLHRQVPDNAIVKKVVWLGTYHPNQRCWRWAIAITVEEPPAAAVLTGAQKLTGALDLGWRLFEGYLRLGMLTIGGQTMVEFRLPLVAPGMRSGRFERCPPDRPDLLALSASYASLIEYDRLIAAEFDQAKAWLKDRLVPLLRCPPDVETATGTFDPARYDPSDCAGCGIARSEHRSGLPPGFDLMRQGGLVRLSREPQAEEIADYLRRWIARNDRLRAMKGTLSDALTERRRWFYRNLAAWLGRNFAVLAWEENLGIKQLAEAQKGPALEASMRYRHIAAIGEFRQYIEQAAPKYGCVLLDGITKNSTANCWECNELVVKDEVANARLILRCPNGHEWDQDMNAARNLYTELRPQVVGDEHLRGLEIDWGGRMPMVPEQLQSVIVRVHPV